MRQKQMPSELEGQTVMKLFRVAHRKSIRWQHHNDSRAKTLIHSNQLKVGGLFPPPKIYTFHENRGFILHEANHENDFWEVVSTLCGGLMLSQLVSVSFLSAINQSLVHFVGPQYNKQPGSFLSRFIMDFPPMVNKMVNNDEKGTVIQWRPFTDRI